MWGHRGDNTESTLTLPEWRVSQRLGEGSLKAGSACHKLPHKDKTLLYSSSPTSPRVPEYAFLIQMGETNGESWVFFFLFGCEEEGGITLGLDGVRSGVHFPITSQTATSVKGCWCKSWHLPHCQHKTYAY